MEKIILSFKVGMIIPTLNDNSNNGKRVKRSKSKTAQLIPIFANF